MFWISYAAAPISENLIWSGGGWFGAIMTSAGVGAAVALLGLVLGAWQRQGSGARAALRWPEPVSKVRRAAA